MEDKKKKYVRQTKFSFQELVDALVRGDGPAACIPRCLLVNEVGVCFMHGDDSAERILMILLDDEFPEEERFMAYCYLKNQSISENRTFLEIQSFERNPLNEDIVSKAKEKI